MATPTGRGAVRVVVDKTAAAKRLLVDGLGSSEKRSAVTLTTTPHAGQSVKSSVPPASTSLRHAGGRGKRATVLHGGLGPKAALKAAR